MLELSHAVERGQLDRVRSMLFKGANVNEVDKANGGNTPLILASKNGHADMVKLLLTQPKVDVNLARDDRSTALIEACWRGHAEVVRLLLGHPDLNVNLPKHDGRTAFYFACSNNNLDCVRILLASGRFIDTEANDRYGKTPLSFANFRVHKIVQEFRANPLGKTIQLRQRLIQRGFKLNECDLEKLIGVPLSFCSGCAPSKFTSLSQVKVLNLIDCFLLTALPDFIDQMTGLQMLNISSNKFNSEDKELEKLCIVLDKSQVTDLTMGLPMEARSLEHFLVSIKKLQTLDLRGTHPKIKYKFRVEEPPKGLMGTFFGNHLFSKSFLTLSTHYEAKFQAIVHQLVKNLLSNGRGSLELISVDPKIKLGLSEGLSSLPLEMRDSSAEEIIQYVLDLKAGTSVRLYRTKLMVVGYEKVGKTSILEALFPFRCFLREQATTIEIRGKLLRVQNREGQELSINFGGDKGEPWEVREEGFHQVTLSRLHSATPQLTLIFDREEAELREILLHRLRRLAGDERTHGIEIQKQFLSLPPITPQDRRTSVSSLGPPLPLLPSQLELQVWDFGGQHEYYNNHHYFLSARSIFLVVWDVTEGGDGVKGLSFWLRSLRAHLPTDSKLYSIIVVGTHVDRLVNPGASKGLREEELRALFNEHFGTQLPFEYLEVSTWTQGNMDQLHRRIVETALGHPYMGEELPASYLEVERVLGELCREHAALPMVELEREALPRLLASVRGLGLEEARRALQLLHSWGECLHFHQSPLLSKYLVLDPSFLTQKILGGLFNPDFRSYCPGGRLKHQRLRSIWQGYEDRAEYLMALMEQFEVCFRLPDEEEDFWKGESIITGYLPDETPKELASLWPERCPSTTNQLTRVYFFNVIPKELVSRLLVRLNKRMEQRALWRLGLFLEANRTKVLARADLDENRLEVVVRAAELKVARLILETVAKEIDVVSSNYAGIASTFEEVEIDNQEDGGDAPWWKMEPNDLWEERQGGGSPVYVLQVFKDGQVFNPDMFEKLQYAIQKLGGNVARLEEGYAISNTSAFQMLEAYRDQLGAKQTMNGMLFNKKTWKMKPKEGEFKSKDEKNWPNPELRQEVMDVFEAHMDRFEWNQDLTTKVCLVVQGTNAAWDIAQAGFGVVASLDEGFFGKGVYFTSEMKYAEKYLQLPHQSISSNESATLVISAFVPGNPFPVIEHPFPGDKQLFSFAGRPCQAGYQSHYAVVDMDPFPKCYPLTSSGKGKSSAVDEFVSFEVAQTLPLFVIKMKPPKNETRHFSLFFDGKNSTLVVEKEWSSLDFFISSIQHHLKISFPIEIEFFDEGIFKRLASINQLPLLCDRLRANKASSISFPRKDGLFEAPPPLPPRKDSSSSSPPTPSSSLLSLNKVSTSSQFNVKDWETNEVVDWLEDEKMPSIAELAQEQRWDGGLLLGLYDVRDKPAFKQDCIDLGIDKVPEQIKLKGRLVHLFGL